MNIADALHELRSSDCSTAFFRPNHGGTDFRGIDLGYLEGGVAISLCDKTYTGARIMVAKNACPNGGNWVDDFRLCVWDYETRQLRATTDNLAAELNALPRGAAFDAIDGGVLIEADFLEPIELREGEWVLAGDAFYGVFQARSISIASVNCKKSMMGLDPQLGFNNKADITQATVPDQHPTGGYTGGTPGQIGNYVSGNYPWMDLL